MNEPSMEGVHSSKQLSVSVAMCTCNGASYLREQLASILQQESPVYEIVVCDDRSDDDTVNILKEFSRASRVPLIITQNEERLGTTKNFEKAMSLCRGDLIALADQDDVWFPTKITSILAVFNSNPSAGGVFSDALIMGTPSQAAGGSLWSNYRLSQSELEQLRSGQFADVLLRRPVVTGATLVFRRALLDTVLPIPKPWMHDAWLAWKIAIHSTLVPLETPTMYYRVHRGQQIGVPPSRSERILQLWNKCFQRSSSKSKGRALTEYRHQHVELGELAEQMSRGGQELRNLRMRLMQKASFCDRAAVAIERTRLYRLQFSFRHWRQYRDYSYLGLGAIVRDLLL